MFKFGVLHFIQDEQTNQLQLVVETASIRKKSIIGVKDKTSFYIKRIKQSQFSCFFFNNFLNFFLFEGESSLYNIVRVPKHLAQTQVFVKVFKSVELRLIYNSLVKENGPSIIQNYLYPLPVGFFRLFYKSKNNLQIPKYACIYRFSEA